jgi:hypothetical protein
VTNNIKYNNLSNEGEKGEQRRKSEETTSDSYAQSRPGAEATSQNNLIDEFVSKKLQKECQRSQGRKGRVGGTESQFSSQRASR